MSLSLKSQKSTFFVEKKSQSPRKVESFNLLLCKTAVSLSAVLVAHSVLFISGQDTLSVLSSLLLHHNWSSIPHLFGRDHPLIIDSSTFGRASTADHDCSPYDHIWPSWSALTLLVSRWTLIIPDHPCWSTQRWSWEWEAFTVVVGHPAVLIRPPSGAPSKVRTRQAVLWTHWFSKRWTPPNCDFFSHNSRVFLEWF